MASIISFTFREAVCDVEYKGEWLLFYLFFKKKKKRNKTKELEDSSHLLISSR